jgi:hypothetical protein
MFPNLHRLKSLLPGQLRDRVVVFVIGLGVIFASLGLGEAVYRFLFFEFDGATDRLPIEMVFGLVFAWVATKILKKLVQYRAEAPARIDLIRARNRRIREAIAALPPAPYIANQQVVRVIREELDRIDWTLREMLPR